MWVTLSPPPLLINLHFFGHVVIGGKSCAGVLCIDYEGERHQNATTF